MMNELSAHNRINNIYMFILKPVPIVICNIKYYLCHKIMENVLNLNIKIMIYITYLYF